MNIPDRIYSQYRTKPKAVDWFNIAREMSGDLEAAAVAVRNMYDIDNNVGAQLDIIGRIVVYPRDFIGNTLLNAVSFSTDDAQFGDMDAQFSEYSVFTDSLMSDEIYRIALRAKIFKNNGDATIESILEEFFIIVPMVEYVQVLDTEDMSFSIEFTGTLTAIQIYALLNVELVQKPQGVQFLGFFNITDALSFGDANVQFGNDDAEFSDIRSS